MNNLRAWISTIMLICWATHVCGQPNQSGLSLEFVETPQYGSAFKVVVDTLKFELSIVSTTRASGFSSLEPSLRALASGQLRMGKLTSAAVILSAGFGSHDPTSSAGLIVENHVEVVPLALKTPWLSGVLCIPRRAAAVILTVRAYLAAEVGCQWAVQGRLVSSEYEYETGKDRQDDRKAPRLVACTNRGQANLIFFFLSDATLRELQRTLTSRICDVALLLTSPEQAGVITASDVTGSRPRSYGSTDAPIPAIIVIPNRPAR